MRTSWLGSENKASLSVKNTVKSPEEYFLNEVLLVEDEISIEPIPLYLILSD